MNDKIIFSDKRRTLVIKIVRDEVLVYAPKCLDNEKGWEIISAFIRSKAGWIDKKTKEYRQNITAYPGLLELKTFYWHGEEITYDSSDKRRRIDFDGIVLTVPRTIADNDTAMKFKLKRALQNQAEKELLHRLSVLSASTGLHYDRCGLTDAASKWGTCTAAKKITLNWRLALIGEPLADYVMLHELCHLKQMNHSLKFRNMLADFLPEWKLLRSKLRRNDFIMQYLR